MSTLKKIEEWFYSQCNGDWEHGEGIKISTLDNPGWAVDISLSGTELNDKPYQMIKIERSEQNWLWCSVRDSKFMIRCGSKNLEEALEAFCRWANS